MLEFNPYFRVSAKDLIKNPVFDKIRVKEKEVDAPFEIQIDVEDK